MSAKIQSAFIAVPIPRIYIYLKVNVAEITSLLGTQFFVLNKYAMYKNKSNSKKDIINSKAATF